MIVLIMDIVTMVHVSVEKDSLVAIAQFHLAQIIVSLVVHVLIIHAFALQDGQILIALFKCAPKIVVEMDIVKMELVFVILILVVLIVQLQFALEIVMEMEFA